MKGGWKLETPIKGNKTQAQGQYVGGGAIGADREALDWDDFYNINLASRRSIGRQGNSSMRTHILQTIILKPATWGKPFSVERGKIGLLTVFRLLLSIT